MAIRRTELRAFPRLSCAKPATLLIEGLQLAGQLLDVSLGGCKALPSKLEHLVEMNLQPGAKICLDVEGYRLDGRVVWATPNYSALGCSFDQMISHTLLSRLAVADLSLAAE